MHSFTKVTNEQTMMTMRFAAALTLVMLSAHLAAGRIYDLNIDRADNRQLVHVQSFGFAENGQFNLVLKKLQLWYKHEDAEEIGKRTSFQVAFVLLQRDKEGDQAEEIEGKCLHQDSDGEKFLLTSPNDWTEKTISKTITEAGAYHLYFSFCEPTLHYTLQLHLETYNIDSSGNRDYLSVGERTLPAWFFTIFALIGLQLIVWGRYLWSNRQDVKHIHHLMTLVLFFKFISVMLEGFEYYSFQKTGLPHGWNVAYYIFSFLKGMGMFAVIVLIGTGWSYLKPFLTDRDKQLMQVVLVVQAMVNIAIIFVDETSEGAPDWITWRDLLHLLDMICCCAILFPIVWSIRHLREAAAADGKAAENMERLQRFRKFYLLVVAYIYFTRIIVFLVSVTVAFEYTWICRVFEELASIIFFTLTGYLFRPQAHNPYLALDREDSAPAPRIPDL